MFFDSNANDRQYGAESFREWCHRFFSNGIAKDEDGGYGFAVSSAGGRNITVSPGVAFINGAIKVMREPVTIEIPEFSGAGSYVVKNIVIEFNTDRDTRDMIVATDGPASGDANDPVRENSRWQLVIARVRCPDKAERNNVLPEDITDTRADAGLCGFMHCSIDETNVSEVANTFRTYMSALGTDEKAKYDAWFANISSKIDQTIFDILDDLNAALDTVKQAGTEASSLNGQVTALNERTARFDTEYKAVASTSFTKVLASSASSTNLKTILQGISLPATGIYSWTSLKKILLTFQWPAAWKSYEQPPEGISLTMSRRNDSDYYNTHVLFITDYNIYGTNSGQYNSSSNYDLNTIFLEFNISIGTDDITTGASSYAPNSVGVKVVEVTTGAGMKQTYDPIFETVTSVFSKPLTEAKYYDSDKEDTIEVSNLKIIGIF